MPEPALARVDLAAPDPPDTLRALHVGPELWAPAPHAGSPFRPTRTEPGRRVRALVGALAAAGDEQTVLTTVAGRHRRQLESHPRVRVLPLPTRGWGDLPLVRTLSAVTSLAASVDVVHLHLVHERGLAASAAIAATVTRPVVVHLHTSRAVPLRTGGTASWRSRVVESALEGRVLGAARAVVVPSARLAEVARDAGAGRVEVVPPAVLPVTESSDAPPLPHLGAGRRIVSVGPLTARRRADALVHALALQPPDTHLLLLGGGPQRLQVDREVRRLGLDGRVHVLPTLSWQVVADHLAHADAVATAALSGEDTTVTLLAMGLGRPTVGTAVESLPAIVSDGVDGRLVPPGDDDGLAGALRDVLTDRDRAASLGASARRRVAAADWVRHAARVRALATEVTPQPVG